MFSALIPHIEANSPVTQNRLIKEQISQFCTAKKASEMRSQTSRRADFHVRSDEGCICVDTIN